MQRRTFPTTIELVDGSTWKTVDGKTAFKVGNAERRVPTEAELDQMLFDLVIDTLRGNNPNPDPPPPPSRPTPSCATRRAHWA